MHCPKSYGEALLLKEKGNDWYRKGQTTNALKYYTEAIFLAPWPVLEQQKRADQLQALSPHVPPILTSPDSTPSEDDREGLLAICFGNRSATLYEFGKYKECLQDIELALTLGVPASSRVKLLRRKQRCSEQKMQLKRDEDEDEQMLCNVFESSHITVNSSAESGRYLKATNDIQPGTVVVAEEPFAAVLEEQFKMTHCSFCFSETTSLFPCCWCTAEGYCSDECACKAWLRYHWAECKKPLAHLKTMGTLPQLCLRISLQAESNHSLTGQDLPTTVKSSYSVVFSLLTHKDKFADNSQRKLLEEMAQALTTHYGEFISCSSLPPRELFLHHLFQLMCNTHTISSMSVTTGGERPDLLSSSQEGMGTTESLVNRLSEVKLGPALYPTLSLINHSCNPNAIVRFAGNKASLCVTRLISAGEEVNISYGPQVGRTGRVQRQAELKRKYFFDCSCTACKNLAAEVQDALLCPSCTSGPLIIEQKPKSVSCSTCGHAPSKTELHEREEKRMKTRQMYREAVENESINLQLLIECQLLQTEVLHKNNMELAQTNDAIAQAYANKGDFVSSSYYCELSCQAVGVAYGDDSIELGNELFKLAQLFFNSRSITKALKTADKALSIIKVHRGSLHSDCLELNSMIEALATNN